MPIELQTMPPAPGATRSATLKSLGAINIGRSRSPGINDRIIFTEQLALLLETGTPLHGAITGLAQQAGDPALEKLLVEIASDIEQGERFSVALAKHPGMFSSTYVNIVAASESSGFLFKALQHLQAEDEKRDELRKSIKSTLSYPVFLIGFSVLVVLFVLIGVFPKFAEMFVRIKDQLPATTIALMWCSDALRTYWWQILLFCVGSGVLVVRWATSAQGKIKIDGWKLTIPVIRDIFVQLYITQSFRVMSLSLSHGVSIVDALSATRDVVNNHLYRNMLVTIESSVQSGGTMAEGINESKFMPRLVKQMLATAESTGNVGMVMGRVAAHYERELNRRLDAMSKMAEPIMLLVMGVVVGIIVSSLILPIFKLSKAVT